MTLPPCLGDTTFKYVLLSTPFMTKYCQLLSCNKELTEEIGTLELRIFKRTGKIALYFDSTEHFLEWITSPPIEGHLERAAPR